MDWITEAGAFIDRYNLLEILGTLVGILYLWYEWKANINLWIVGIIMPAIYLFVYYRAGLYADFGINIYYLLAGVYGWFMWKYGDRLFARDKAMKAEPEIGHTPYAKIVPLAVAFLVAFIAIRWILMEFTDSNVPNLDALTTALSIVGLWMLAKKYVEQWWVWIAVDAVSCGLYIYKGIYFTSALYGLYTVVAFFGYYKWLKLMRDGEKQHGM